MASPGDDARGTNHLRQRRPSHDDLEEPESLNEAPGPYTTSDPARATSSSHFHPDSGPHRSRTTRDDIHPSSHNQASRSQANEDITMAANHGRAHEELRESISNLPPLSLNTTQLPSSSAATRAPTQGPRVSFEADPFSSSALPSRRATTSPISPTGRMRGYSLRRAVFNKGISRQSTGMIELVEAGPSQTNNEETANTSQLGQSGKKRESTVLVSPVYTYDDLPPRPEPKKTLAHPFRTTAFPNYDTWIKKQKRPVFITRIEDTYRVIKKRVLRIKEIPPSRDGRHIDIDPLRKEPLVDERRNGPFVTNVIRSCRYTVWNFLPKQLVFQFGKLANFYFLIISILQMIPGLSTTGTYTTIVPLLVFISISMAKEGYDDIRRYKLDKAENRKETSVLQHTDGSEPADNDLEDQVSGNTDSGLHWTTKRWQDVKVGDIIRLKRDEAVPADLLLLHADGMSGVAYIETMALDGETNLKPKQAPPSIAEICHNVDGISRCKAHVVAEDPNLDLYNFEGRVTLDGSTLPLTTNEIVFRGSVLRNTSEAFGMVINTGEECKIRMNANKNPRIKAPSLQAIVNKVVIIVVVVVLFIACINAILYQIWYRNVERHSWYLNRARVAAGPSLMGFIIMFNTMIPLSLYVSMEIIKLGQLFLMQDVDMYDPVSNTPFESHTTTINEELGQVSYIFSDKTGTLTDNMMRFRKLTVAGVAWLHDVDLRKEAERQASTGSNMNQSKKGKSKASEILREAETDSTYFSADYSMDVDNRRPSMSTKSVAESLWKSTARPAKAQPELNTEELLEYLHRKPNGVFARKARFFLLSLALCHTCLPEVQEDGNIDFQAASPDELALVRAAQELGYMVVDRAAQTITLRIRPNGPDGDEVGETYEILDVIEFSSKRKRMSIIVRFPDGRRCIFCKGADTILMKRLKFANLAFSKAAEVERRASIRKSLEAEHALRRQSEAVGMPRTSLTLSRHSMGDRPRHTLSGRKLQPVRDQLDAWLGEREHDVDLTSVDNPAAYTNPKRSLHLESGRPSFAASSVHDTEQDDEYWDDMVDESIAMDERAIFERCFQHIDDFATEGLRTLLYGYKFIDEQEYLGWKKVFQEASTSFVDRQELIERAGDMIEQDFELAGATAIEDKLQKGVPETIDKLRRANIKMWMLTGDKRETAINIGHSCRLIKDYSKVVILDHEKSDVDQLMATAVLDIRRRGVAHSVIVVDGQTLAEIESNETLSALFLDLAVISDSVICCRASPSQKALLVKKIRLRVEGSVTLAIGDGANDIAMIQEAHVGIGITGKEGLQAARISDYAFAQFRFLQKLLLVHGRWNYVRTSKYVLGTFWKEMLFYLTQALFQHKNGYTGTSLYESWSLSMFNTLFTSVPVIFLGIFEQDLSASTLLAVPELYSMGQRNEAFYIWKYIGWMLMAITEAVLIFFTMYMVYALPSIAKDVGLFAMGDLSFSCCVIIINTKLLFIEMHRKTWVALFGWLLSVIGWTLWNVLLSLIYSNKTSLTYSVRSGFIRHFGGNGIWWIILHLIVSIFLLFELVVIYTRKTFWETDVDAFQRLEKDKVIKQRLEAAAEGRDPHHNLQDEKENNKDRMAEREIQDLLNSSRITGQSDNSSSRGPRHELEGETRRGPSLQLSPIETGRAWGTAEDLELEEQSAAAAAAANRISKRASLLRHTEP